MKKFKLFTLSILCLALVISTVGCSLADKITAFVHSSDDEEIITTEATHGVYWMNQGETRLLKVPYEVDTSSPEAIIASCIEGLKQTPDDNGYKCIIAGNVEVTDYSYESSNKLATISFSSKYKELSTSQEILARAAIVRTLTQFSDDIQYVSFNVGTVPLAASDGSRLMMRGKDFVSNISGNMEYVREDYVTLYFANEDRTMLQQEDVVVKYLSKINLETAVVNSLISGPISSGLQPTLSTDIVVNKVNVKEGVCYVDLDETFFERIDGQKFELNIYSIVNTLTQLAGITRVQFLIDGVIFTGTIDGMRIDSMFEKNMSLVYRPEKESVATTAAQSGSALSGDIEGQVKDNQNIVETEENIGES
ncbi:MAG: hypothetical protein EOM34_05555 [Clostridia bacterium]|nr:GerMN domain-containing protein [Lachnospiraceae bacterium]NCC00128.1 hypothetical protein [Clostridia bacterium]NCD01610.1 hypothetical protein [Clostridia bacterium]